MHPSQRLMYRRVAAVCGLIGVIAIIVGIAFYADKHTARGLTGIIVGVVFLVVGIAAALIARRDRQRRRTARRPGNPRF
jgi:uncharacterized membrane protein HdeD (DUF308 family)